MLIEAGAPLEELSGDGPMTPGEAVDALLARPSRDDRTGRFTAGNVERLKTGATSMQLWSALRDAKAAIVARVISDLGLQQDGPETLLGLVSAYAETRLLRESMFEQITRLGGPVTTKGKSRAVLNAYYQALDRETRLAATLGLERRARSLTPSSPSAYLEAQASKEPDR